MKKSEAIKDFLKYSTSPLAALYNHNMEVQVMVAKDNGIKHIGEYKNRKWKGWKNPDDHKEIWKHFRMPINAGSDPIDNDSELYFSLADHAEGIGMTGWDYKNKVTRWVGFDFDSIVNHKAGISDSELDRVRKELERISWVEINTSTSGNGYHAYVYFESGYPAANHNEHAALARSILSVMSAEVGYNFNGSVDCVGSILWVWHRKQEGTRGLQHIKEKESFFPLEKVPINWRDHLSVVKDRRRRTNSSDEMDEVTKAIQEVRLEPEHRMIMNWMNNNAQCNYWYDMDRSMIIGHTEDFLACHKALGLKGLYSTDSSGSSEHNCFAVPIRGGGFLLRRFGYGVKEHASWETDSKGWTKIKFNSKATYEQASGYYGGLLDEKGQFIFNTIWDENNNASYSATTNVSSALSTIGITLEFSERMRNRNVVTQFDRKNNRICVYITAEKNDSTEVGWILKKNQWLKVFNYSEDEYVESTDINIDNYIRHAVSDGYEDGYYVNVEGNWVSQSKGNVDAVLTLLLPDLKANEKQAIIGQTVLKPWNLVSIPFEEEYPSARVWNKCGAQLAYEPERGTHFTWDTVLEHAGSSLDNIVIEDSWCIENGITTGADFLFIWVAYMLKEPDQQLPYLFFFGEQNTGKSTFHEALELLFENGRGYTKGEQALTNAQGFNGEFDGAVLAAVEEINLNKNQKAYDRIKELVTAKNISIRALYKNSYMRKNYLHFIQCSNHRDACPVFEGDTRVIVMEVPPLKTEIDKHVLLMNLRQEAPAFLNSIFEFKLPEKTGRLAIPILSTDAKIELQNANMNVLERYMKDFCYLKKGHKIPLKEFVSQFTAYLELGGNQKELAKWNPYKIAANIPLTSSVIKGRDRGDNKTYLANISFDPEAIEDGMYILDRYKKLKFLTEEDCLKKGIKK